MKNAKRVKLIVLLLAVFLLVAGFAVHLNKIGVPHEYKEVVEQYIKLRGENDPVAYDLCYFRPENKHFKQLMIDGCPVLLGAEVERYEKISDDLYAFLAKYELSEIYEKGYSFVANIDGQIQVIVNIRDVPDSIAEGINIEKYRYFSENSGSGELLT